MPHTSLLVWLTYLIIIYIYILLQRCIVVILNVFFITHCIYYRRVHDGFCSNIYFHRCDNHCNPLCGCSNLTDKTEIEVSFLFNLNVNMEKMGYSYLIANNLL